MGRFTGRGKREGGKRGEGDGEKYTTLCYTLRSKKGREVGVTKKMDDHTQKQRKIKIKPKIKLNHNSYNHLISPNKRECMNKCFIKLRTLLVVAILF